MNHFQETLVENLTPEDQDSIHSLKGKSGVYIIVSQVNGKPYIGRSVDLHNRYKEHFSLAKYKRSNGRKLCNAKDKYGLDSFKFYVVEFCDPDHLAELEKIYIESCDSVENGYNTRSSSDDYCPFSIPQEQRDKISASVREYHKSHENSFKGKKHSDLSLELIRKNIRNEDGSLKNSWVGSERHKEFSKRNGRIQAKKLNEWIKVNGDPKRKKVQMLDKESGDLIREFDSIKEAASFVGCRPSNISNCLNGRSSSAKGYLWKIKE